MPAAGSGLLAVLVGLAAAWALYANAAKDPLPAKLGALSRCDAEPLLLR